MRYQVITVLNGRTVEYAAFISRDRARAYAKRCKEAGFETKVYDRQK